MSQGLLVLNYERLWKLRANVVELKLRTRYNHCGVVGRWATECPKKRTQSYKGGGRENKFMEESEYLFTIVGEETRFCDWSHEHASRFTCPVESDTPVVAAEHATWPEPCHCVQLGAMLPYSGCNC